MVRSTRPKRCNLLRPHIPSTEETSLMTNRSGLIVFSMPFPVQFRGQAARPQRQLPETSAGGHDVQDGSPWPWLDEGQTQGNNLVRMPGFKKHFSINYSAPSFREKHQKNSDKLLSGVFRTLENTSQALSHLKYLIYTLRS